MKEREWTFEFIECDADQNCLDFDLEAFIADLLCDYWNATNSNSRSSGSAQT